MTPAKPALEERRLRQVADRYTRDGYEVVIEPRAEQLPPWLRGFRPDLLARRADEQVIVEVKSRESLHGEEGMPELAALIEREPGWRLELVLTNPRSQEDARRRDALQGSWHAEEYAREARDLLARDVLLPAFILAWTAFETTARTAMAGEGIPVHSVRQDSLLKTLLSLGYITSTDELQVLELIGRKRNSVAHGYQPGTTSITRQDVEHLLSAGDRIRTIAREAPTA